MLIYRRLILIYNAYSYGSFLVLLTKAWSLTFFELCKREQKYIAYIAWANFERITGTYASVVISRVKYCTIVNTAACDIVEHSQILSLTDIFFQFELPQIFVLEKQHVEFFESSVVQKAWPAARSGKWHHKFLSRALSVSHWRNPTDLWIAIWWKFCALK